MNGGLFFASPAVGRTIRIAYRLVEQELTLANPAGEMCVRLRGDTVASMDNFDADLAFFDTIE